MLYWFEFWMFYMRFFFSIEVSWDDQYFSTSRFLSFRLWNLKNRCNRDLRIWFEKSLSSWFSHLNSLIWKITVIVIFASNIILLDFYQSALKIWKPSSWMTQKKHDLMTRTVCCFQYREFDFVQLTTFDMMTDNWLIDRKFWIRVTLYFLFFYFSHWIDELFEKNDLNAKDVVIAIALNIKFRKSSRISILILNAQLDRATIFENVFNTIQFFMRRKFWAINSTKWRHEIVMRTWASRCLHDCSSQLLVKEMYLQNVERVSISMIVRINCIVKKIASVVLLTFKYVFAVWSWSLYDFTFWLYFLILLFDFTSCQCWCFLIDVWNLAKLSSSF